MKICVKCKQNRDLSRYYKRPRNKKDGLTNTCKDCYNLKERALKEADPERFRKKDLAYRAKHKADILRKMREKGAKNRHKNRARHLLKYHIKSGKIIRKPCEVCFNQKSEGHHEDYSKPLEVIWLCRRHHARRHEELKTLGVKL